MTKCHARVAHMAKHINMVGDPLWWGAWTRVPWSPPKFGAGTTRNNT